MTNALRTLLTGIVDYAGTFPPANLPFDQALANYLRYRREPEGWMLGRFVCPTTRISEANSAETPPVSLLGRGGETRAAILHGLRQDLADVAVAKNINAAMLELRFPPNFCGTHKTRDASGLFAAVEQTIETSPTPTLQVYYELPSANLAEKPLHAFCETLAMANNIGAMRKVRRVPAAGVKLRCAGQKEGEFPSSEQVAMVIAECRRHNLHLKFTAGLHHPLRHAGGHGFLNVFIAGVLAHSQRFDVQQLTQVLESSNATEFTFSEIDLRWRDVVVTTAEIETARKGLVTSFGSCSFDEPRDGLRLLKLL